MTQSLGLDISTSCTGICVLDKDGKVSLLTSVSFPSKLTFWEKADLTEKTLKKLKDKHKLDITSFFIEESLQKFRAGFSSAKTLTTLSKFNGITCFIGRKIFNLDPTPINVNTARKSVGLKIPKGMNAKDVVFEWVSNEIDFKCPTKILQSGPRKGKEILRAECYDMSDAYLIARAAQTLIK